MQILLDVIKEIDKNSKVIREFIPNNTNTLIRDYTPNSRAKQSSHERRTSHKS